MRVTRLATKRTPEGTIALSPADALLALEALQALLSLPESPSKLPPILLRLRGVLECLTIPKEVYAPRKLPPKRPINGATWTCPECGTTVRRNGRSRHIQRWHLGTPIRRLSGPPPTHPRWTCPLCQVEISINGRWSHYAHRHPEEPVPVLRKGRPPKIPPSLKGAP